ncbi:Na+-driven multidrug efflux pump [Streptacidiphilus sp. MAP12-33]|uniref:MATE family efflux transporter n=1 Tax=Streptacidiphilus sp. MAP12-33 TaxID=3156266 RepID=UPI003517BF75
MTPAPTRTTAPDGAVEAVTVPIRKEIADVANPVAFGAVVWVGGQSVVAALLGHLGGDALYVRGLLVPVGLLFVALQEALEVVTQVGTARCLGRGDVTALRGLCLRLGGVGLVGCGAVGVAVSLAAPALAALLHVPPGAADDFVAVLSWTALVTALGVPVNVATAMLRGGGRPRAGAALTFVVVCVQIAGVWLFGVHGGLGVFSLPWATGTSVACGAVLGAVLLRGGVRVPGGAESGGPPVDARALVLGVGLPIAATYVMLSASNFVVEWILTPFGARTVAGYGAAVTVQSVAVVPALALGTAAAVTANRRWSALRAAHRAGLRIALGAYALIALTALLAAEPIGHAMASDGAVAAEVTAFLRIMGPSFLGFGLVLFQLTFLEQTGSGRLAATVNLCYFATTLTVGGLLARTLGDPHALYVVWAAANVLGVPLVTLLTSRRTGSR